MAEDRVLPSLRMPNFFIVGAARAGTTSLHEYLRHHPKIFLPHDLYKEPGYYSELTGLTRRAAYLELFRSARPECTRIGEASTAYLTDPAAAKRIHSDVPDAQVIVVLRNPADRAYSLYNWMVSEGYEWIPTFSKALKAEGRRALSHRFRRRCPQYFHNYLYFSSGLYSEQVTRFYRHFGRERVFVLIFEEFIQDPELALGDICRFLGVEPVCPGYLDVHNASRTAMFPPLQVFLRRATDQFLRLRLVRPETKRSRDRLLRLGQLDQAPRPMLQKTRLGLLERYRTDVEQLEVFLKKDLSLWLSDLTRAA